MHARPNCCPSLPSRFHAVGLYSDVGVLADDEKQKIVLIGHIQRMTKPGAMFGKIEYKFNI